MMNCNSGIGSLNNKPNNADTKCSLKSYFTNVQYAAIMQRHYSSQVVFYSAMKNNTLQDNRFEFNLWFVIILKRKVKTDS
jgi:hypothetical protein